MEIKEKIVLNGIRTHNLKNIDITIPKNKIITITGVSGSGKSSLAFDTIYKEGQFRYIESLSSYLRQFFNLGTRPEIDYSQGLSPAIAIEQNKRVGNIRSTVGTLTEIDDYLRLLFAKLGDLYCYKCGEKIQTQTVDSIIQDIQAKFDGKKIYLLEELREYDEEKDLQKFIRSNRKKVDKGGGYVRYLIFSEGEEVAEYFYLEEVKIPKEYYPVKVYGIYDRVTIDKDKIQRLKEDIIKILAQTEKFGVYNFSAKKATINWYTDKSFCANCNISYPEFTTQHFSPNRQEGACETCHGIGESLQVDFEKIIDENSPYMKAVLPWRDSALGQGIMEKLAYKYSIKPSTIWRDLPIWFKEVVLNGDDELLRVSMGGKYMSLYYKGIEDILTQQYHKGLLTVDFQAMLQLMPCPECGGAKLKKQSLNVFVTINRKKYNIYDLQNMPIKDLVILLQIYLDKSKKATQLLNRILNPLLDRAKTIQSLGLGYISTYRQIDTLSGGEIQRLRLAKQLGNKLTGIIYVLDEPTIGLDEKEIKNTINAIKQLQDMGNTIIVVEHNEAFIKNSDRIVEIGPAAGDFGGEVVYNGPYKDFLKTNTITNKYISGKKKVKAKFNYKPSNKTLSIRKASKHNLKNIDVQIRLGSFTIITGASGAGKTTLMYHILYRFLSEKDKFIQSYIRLQLLKQGMTWSEIIQMPYMKAEEYEEYAAAAQQEFYKELGVDTIKGQDYIKNVIYVDQTSIGKTPRSCPATFIGVFDDIRKIFAGVDEAKFMGFTPGHFSFNSNKGACPECQGYGYKKVELQFLPDTYVPCELCKGARYKSEILGIKWRGKNISQILDMYVKDALEFFQDMGFVADKLQLMCDIGLGYLKMGQPAHTMSGGESQRLKLVKHLLKTYKGHSVYFLDEPTVGLHPSDIEKLLGVLAKFLEKGDTILMIEHDQNLIKFADDVIRLEEGDLVKGKKKN